MPNSAGPNRTPSYVAHVLLAITAVVLSSVASAANLVQTTPTLRCGWFDNPTPGNAWLIDRDAQWIVGMQGGHQADGDWPEFEPKEWTSSNRSYGYGCACMSVIANAKTHEIERILSAKARPLSACKRDPSLAKRKP